MIMAKVEKPHGAGKSSFDFVNLSLLFQALPLFPTTVFLDLGCGRGNYTIPVAKAIGPKGRVYGIDAWQEGLDDLKSRFLEEGIKNIETVRANLNEHIPIKERKRRHLLHGDRSSRSASESLEWGSYGRDSQSVETLRQGLCSELENRGQPRTSPQHPPFTRGNRKGRRPARLREGTYS